MKPICFSILLALLASSILPSTGHGQEKTASSSANSGEKFRFEEIALYQGEKLPPGEKQCLLIDAVDLLFEYLRAENQPIPNLLYGPGVEKLEIPALLLHNVTALGALQLIAASADCEIEPIKSEERELYNREEVVGWIIAMRKSSLPAKIPALKPTTHGADLTGGGGLPRTDGEGGAINFTNGTEQGNKTLVSNPGTDIQPGTSPSPLVRQGRVRFGSGGAEGEPLTIISAQPGAVDYGPSGVVGFGGGIDPMAAAPTATMVYPLGDVVEDGKLAEIEDTIQKMLAESGIASEQTRLSFHDKTKVLVVHGPEPVHQMVGTLIEALQKNRQAADQQRRLTLQSEMQAAAAKAEMEVQKAALEGAMREKAAMEKAAGEIMVLQQKIRELEEALQKARPAADNAR